MQGKVEICGINTARLEILKNDEMMELLRRTKQGDMAARERLIRGNLRLVLSVIQRFSSRGENADDLFQVGCIGLIKGGKQRGRRGVDADRVFLCRGKGWLSVARVRGRLGCGAGGEGFHSCGRHQIQRAGGAERRV